MDRIRDLIERINELNYHYYTLDEPLISDGEYDKLYDELVRLEKERGFKDKDSPTNRVGGDILEGFEKHDHLGRLYSLDKAQSIGQVLDWINRTGKLISEARRDGYELSDPEYVLEYKFDGLTINLTYDKGLLIDATTRGNGITGERVIDQIRTISSIPLAISYKGLMEVQGEGLMPLSSLEAYNKTAPIPLKNARNAAAGAIRNLDPKETKKRKLDAYFYNVGYLEEEVFSSHLDMLAFLEKNKFKVNKYRKVLRDIRDIEEELARIKEERKFLDYLTDGVVIKINDIKTRRVLGSTNKFPRWAIAYKFEAEEFTTKLLEVEWNVGRTGKVTPTALLEPVDIDGVRVKRATLNNFEDIQRKKLKLGSRVFIRRSNDVIPEILGVVENTEEDTKEIIMPALCPFCHSELIKDGVHFFCNNSISCKPQMVSRIVHFVSREAMNIDGLSEKTIEKMIEVLGLDSVDKLYDLTEEDLIKLDGFNSKERKKAKKLLLAIEDSKKVKLANFLNALGIAGVGVKTARDLADKYKSLEVLRSKSQEDLKSISDIGDIMAASIYEFFHDERIVESLNLLLSKGIVFEESEEKEEGKLTGKKLVITGTLVSYKRKDLEELLTSKGASVSSSVSKNTDYLILGENPGSKYEKAKSLGVEIIEEKDLEDFLA